MYFLDVDLISLFDECILLFFVCVKDKKIEFNMYCSYSVFYYVEMDFVVFFKVVVNIFDNVVKFMVNGLIDVIVIILVKN